MLKTISYTALHFAIAFTVAYLLTGSVTLGSLIALTEPLVCAFAFYIHDRIWWHFKPYQLASIKAGTFAVIHFWVAFSVAYVISGDVLIGSLIAMIEPTLNVVAYYFHERLWMRYFKTARIQYFSS